MCIGRQYLEIEWAELKFQIQKTPAVRMNLNWLKTRQRHASTKKIRKIGKISRQRHARQLENACTNGNHKFWVNDAQFVYRKWEFSLVFIEKRVDGTPVVWKMPKRVKGEPDSTNCVSDHPTIVKSHSKRVKGAPDNSFFFFFYI